MSSRSFVSPMRRVSLKKFTSCVRPGVLEANASRPCRVMTLMVVDFPALLRPAKAISGRPAAGSWLTFAAEVSKRAESKSDTGKSLKKAVVLRAAG